MRFSGIIFCSLMLCALTGAGFAQMASMDSGATARSLVGWDEALLEEWGKMQPWLRIRSRPDPSDPENEEVVLREKEGLRRLRGLGFKPLPFMHWSPSSWKSGVRNGTRMKVPLDLREAYQRVLSYGQVYGEVVAGFEIENEPDISFVGENAETFLAFQKALYLGLKRSSLEAEIGDLPSPRLWQTGRSSELGDRAEIAEEEGGEPLVTRSQGLGASRQKPATSLPLVVMAPLALPPGPYFEELVENGLFSYTDAFNYHYYGYAEDFPGVHRQFHEAVMELAANSEERGARRDESSKLQDGAVRRVFRLPPHVENTEYGEHAMHELGKRRLEFEVRRSKIDTADAERNISSNFQLQSSISVKRTLPVLLTEYGYGLLTGPASDTVEGRVRQWYWFKSVGEQVQNLKIAGPMAFYLPPYFERELNEFGLTVRSKAARGSLEQAESGTLPFQAGEAEDGVKPESGNRKLEGEIQSSEARKSQVSGIKYQVSNLTFTPADFGLEQPEFWMRHIGRRFGANEASPALAWLYEQGARHPYEPKNWEIRTPEPSPVVIDFIAGQGLQQMKRYGGYVAMRSMALVVSSSDLGTRSEGRSETLASREATQGSSRRDAAGEGNPPSSRLRRDKEEDELRAGSWELGARSEGPFRTGAGQLVLYNFSDQPIRGRLEVMEGRDLVGDLRELESERLLEPMERMVIPVRLRVSAKTFSKHKLRLIFVSSGSSLASSLRTPSVIDPGQNRIQLRPQRGQLQGDRRSPESVFATAFYPNALGMKETVLEDFRTRIDAASGNMALLESRPLATEEPRLEHSSGRWRTTPGVEVVEAYDGSWKFTIRDFPLEPNRPAMAELPLPDDFEFPDGGMMKMIYRLLDPSGADLKSGQYFDLYFRTANGNLYQVWPRQYAMARWQAYTEVKDNYTMAFYGRANLPWRFRDNRPVALVFFFRPEKLPATYEVKNARIVKLTN